MTILVGVTHDLETCLALRKAVFIDEQGVSEADERDGRDADAIHLLARRDGIAVGCARILVAGGTGKIGRVCVLPSERGTGLGRALIEACIETLAARDDVHTAKLGAQIHAMGFYERLGFAAVGPDYMDAGIAHRDMVRPI